MFLLFCLGIFIAVVAFQYIKVIKQIQRRHQDVFHLSKQDLKATTSVLFVTSHPDDECMFFSPTLVHLREKNIAVHLLCLSAGNFYGVGKTRKAELIASCLKLGIPTTRVHHLDEFTDDPNSFWPSDLVAIQIEKLAELISARAIFTFDRFGVSGHINHIAVFEGARKIKKSIPVFSLETVNVIRKYIQVVDILFSDCFSNTTLVVSDFKGYAAAYNAMLCHQSQLVWFRKLYILFSRYMLINTWKRVR